MIKQTLIAILLFWCGGVHASPQNWQNLMRLPPFERAVTLTKYYEQLHTRKHYPYIGYGHRIQPGEHFRLPLTRKQADALLRRDLRKLCKMFRSYGKDSLLLATLAYNVGYGTLMGHANHPKSRLVQKIESGDRNIHNDYIRFCCYKGKVVPSIRKRRKVELLLLYQK